MKKIIISLLIFAGFFSNTVCSADEAKIAKTPVRFIYINGSNSNTENDKFNFIKGIRKMHVSMKKNFEANSFVQKNMLDDGKFYILDNPKTFFWGYNSNEALNSIKNDLLTLKMISPKMAQTVRSIIAGVMHDAIWVQKEYNMQVIVNNLHKEVMNAHKNGEKVVLFGHSAGSFVTYRYLFHKLPAISTDEMLTYAKTDKNINFYKHHPVKATCLDAITESGIGLYSSNGKFVINPNPKQLKADYLNLNAYTAAQCIPDGEVLGVVNFGSPVALFYSDNGTNENINEYNIDLYKYLKNNNMFLLTVNFTDDPIGFPLSKNLSSDELENLLNIKFNQNGRGFFYSKSDVRSPATFIGAHTSYWKYTDKFAKAVTNAYVEGYKNFYSNL